MKTCFVVSPIGDVGSEIRINADKLFKYIISPWDIENVQISQLFTLKRKVKAYHSM